MFDQGPIVEIVSPYLQKLKPSGPRWIMARCPFHDDRTPSFAMNSETGVWVCHSGSCGLRGGLVDFLKGIGMGRDKIDALVDPLREDLERHRTKMIQEARYRFKTGNPFMADRILPEAILGVYDFKPNSLVSKGFDPKLLRSMDIGYDRKQDRIIFPIRDVYGNLVGVSGRATKPGVEPRYKVYSGGATDSSGHWRTGDFGELFDENFPGYKIDSREYLWNAHRVYPALVRSKSAKQEPIIVVEGYKACVWMIQHGFRNTVAVMGSSMTKTQADLLRRLSSEIVLFLDNDTAGRKATGRLGKWLAKSLDVSVCSLGSFHEQPDDLNLNGLAKVVAHRRRFQQWQTWTNSTKMH